MPNMHIVDTFEMRCPSDDVELAQALVVCATEHDYFCLSG